MDDLELIFHAGREELVAMEGRTGQKLELPLAFWREFSESLRRAGYPHFAGVIDQAVSAARARERLVAEKLRCMEPTYDPEAQARCRALLAEDLHSAEQR